MWIEIGISSIFHGLFISKILFIQYIQTCVFLFDALSNDYISMTIKGQAFENIAGKGENAENLHFLLSPQCFLPFHGQFL